jgi:tetratricopeptide (TPR) repeat protein
MSTDLRGQTVSGANARALGHFERALAEHLACRGDPDVHLAAAIAAAPQFAMAHLFAAYRALSGREPGGAAAAAALACVPRRALTRREDMHLAAVAACIAGDAARALALHEAILADHPCDVLALQVAHELDTVRGDVRRLQRRVARVLPAWPRGMPGRHAVLAMHAFALEERGLYARAEAAAHEALALNPWDVRAHHAIVHVHEMRGEPEAGARWAGARVRFWSGATPASVHNWWHVALFHIAAGRPAQALAVYDLRIRPHLGRALSVCIDASALLWRLHLRGVALGERGAALAARWRPHAQDAHSVFSDVHAMMSFAASGEREGAAALLAALQRRARGGDADAALARFVGLPACRAIAAFGARRWREAAALLRALPALARRLGGSRAQQNVLALTLAAADRRAA